MFDKLKSYVVENDVANIKVGLPLEEVINFCQGKKISIEEIVMLLSLAEDAGIAAYLNQVLTMINPRGRRKSSGFSGSVLGVGSEKGQIPGGAKRKAGESKEVYDRTDSRDSIDSGIDLSMPNKVRKKEEECGEPDMPPAEESDTSEPDMLPVDESDTSELDMLLALGGSAAETEIKVENAAAWFALGRVPVSSDKSRSAIGSKLERQEPEQKRASLFHAVENKLGSRCEGFLNEMMSEILSLVRNEKYMMSLVLWGVKAAFNVHSKRIFSGLPEDTSKRAIANLKALYTEVHAVMPSANYNSKPIVDTLRRILQTVFLEAQKNSNPYKALMNLIEYLQGCLNEVSRNVYKTTQLLSVADLEYYSKEQILGVRHKVLSQEFIKDKAQLQVLVPHDDSQRQEFYKKNLSSFLRNCAVLHNRFDALKGKVGNCVRKSSTGLGLGC